MWRSSQVSNMFLAMFLALLMLLVLVEGQAVCPTEGAEPTLLR